jgi:repressor LexA
MKFDIYSKRKELGLSLEEVGKRVGVSKSTVKKWESGFIENMKRDKVALLAEVLHVSPLDILGIEYSEEILPNNIIPIPNTKRVPLLGTIACGNPITAIENPEDYILMPDTVHADFALRCQGDSMVNARILDGDVVYIRRQDEVDNGDIAAVIIGDEATLKRVYVDKENDRLTLMAENPTFPPLVYQGADLEQVRVLGKAVAFLSKAI